MKFSQLQDVTIKGGPPRAIDLIVMGSAAVKARLGERFQVIGGSSELGSDASNEVIDNSVKEFYIDQENSSDEDEEGWSDEESSSGDEED